VFEGQDEGEAVAAEKQGTQNIVCTKVMMRPVVRNQARTQTQPAIRISPHPIAQATILTTWMG
jgi:hypothetical protein